MLFDGRFAPAPFVQFTRSTISRDDPCQQPGRTGRAPGVEGRSNGRVHAAATRRPAAATPSTVMPKCLHRTPDRRLLHDAPANRSAQSEIIACMWCLCNNQRLAPGVRGSLSDALPAACNGSGALSSEGTVHGRNSSHEPGSVTIDVYACKPDDGQPGQGARAVPLARARIAAAADEIPRDRAWRAQ